MSEIGGSKPVGVDDAAWSVETQSWGGTQEEPSAAEQTAGWQGGAGSPKPKANHFNWLFDWVLALLLWMGSKPKHVRAFTTLADGIANTEVGERFTVHRQADAYSTLGLLRRGFFFDYISINGNDLTACATDGERLYVIDASENRVYARSLEDGSELWETDLASTLPVDVCCNGSRVIVTAGVDGSNPELWSLDPSDGSIQLAESIDSGLTYGKVFSTEHGFTFVEEGTHNIKSYEGTTLRTSRAFSSSGAGISDLCADELRVFVVGASIDGGTSTTVMKVWTYLADGTLSASTVWTYALTNRETINACACNGSVVVIAHDYDSTGPRNIQGIRADTGEQIWAALTNAGASALVVCCDDRYAYVVDDGVSIVCYELETGREVWREDSSAIGGSVPRDITCDGERVYVVTEAWGGSSLELAYWHCGRWSRTYLRVSGDPAECDARYRRPGPLLAIPMSEQ